MSAARVGKNPRDGSELIFARTGLVGACFELRPFNPLLDRLPLAPGRSPERTGRPLPGARPRPTSRRGDFSPVRTAPKVTVTLGAGGSNQRACHFLKT